MNTQNSPLFRQSPEDLDSRRLRPHSSKKSQKFKDSKKRQHDAYFLKYLKP